MGRKVKEAENQPEHSEDRQLRVRRQDRIVDFGENEDAEKNADPADGTQTDCVERLVGHRGGPSG